MHEMITPEFRATWVALFTATASKDNPDKLTFSLRAAFPPATDLSAMKAAAAAAAHEKWDDKLPTLLRSPFRRNDELDNPIEGIGDDWIIMTFSSPEKSRPGLVDAKLQDIIDESKVYSGAWFRAEVRPYAYDNKGNKGVSFGLQNVQLLRDGEPLAGSRKPASKAFTAVASAAGATPASIFG